MPIRPQAIFRVPVRLVEVPATVIGSDNKIARGLTSENFRLFDNDRAQSFRLDEAVEAVSIVIAVQNNAAVRAWLPEVSRSAGVLEALVLGAQGEAAILTFADEVSVIQNMTSDSKRLDQAFGALKPSGDASHCIDAVVQAVDLLEQTTVGRRRILLLISQAGDYGSKAQLRDVISRIERENITVYGLQMPRVGKDLLRGVRVSGLGSQGSRDTGFVVSADLTKLVPEIYRGAKSAQGEDAVTLLTRYTGGTIRRFRKRNDLDSAISRIGEEIHTSYLLTFSPNDPATGYHRLRVAADLSGAIVRARPGYYATQPSGN